MNEGGNVWVIGDVHGFNKTLRSLVEKINPQQGDYVVLLGDLIDRGPNSYDVVQFAKTSDNIVCVKGNHEKMMIETDSPYLAPIPFRGKKNEPSYIIHTIEKLAKIKNIQKETLINYTTNNFRKLFNLN